MRNGSFYFLACGLKRHMGTQWNRRKSRCLCNNFSSSPLIQLDGIYFQASLAPWALFFYTFNLTDHVVCALEIFYVHFSGNHFLFFIFLKYCLIAMYNLRMSFHWQLIKWGWWRLTWNNCEWVELINWTSQFYDSCRSFSFVPPLCPLAFSSLST